LPVTTRAVKLNRRPPLTTQAHRRIWTSFSGLLDCTSVDMPLAPLLDF
jgi:hypothetical protein